MDQSDYSDFTRHDLDDSHCLFIGATPSSITPTDGAFNKLWRSHPRDYHEIMMHGRLVRTPRWQQAFDRDYVYTGARNNARPAPPELQVFRDWARKAIDARLNGFLVNWYDGEKGHYIGRHRDSPKGLTRGAPIVTISLGEERAFRMRKARQPGFIDFEISHGSIIILPWATNQNWTHEVPASRKRSGRRISITLRAFLDRTP